MANPYELWNTRKSLGVMRDVKRETFYFEEHYPKVILSEEEYVDFEKLPIRNKKMAPFALPLGRGGSVYDDSQRTYRFKPAYVILDDEVDPLRPLTFAAGIDHSMLDTKAIGPMERMELIKAAITAAHVSAWNRRMEWLRARAIIDGQVTITGKDYPTTLVDFQRDAGHTIVLGSGARFGDSGVSILDFIQARVDQMNDAEFGGIPVKIAMGGSVMSVMRKDEEILKHMDINVRGGAATVDRGIVGVPDGGKVFKFGELLIGGNSGQRIELWVNNETYQDETGASQRYVGAKEMVFTGSPEAIDGHQAFGRIVDEDAEYQAIPLFPKNYRTGGAVKVQHIRHTSSPIAVPINPNATLKATVLA